MKVKPAPGRQVRDVNKPHRLLPPDGRNVPDTTFWRRRLAKGDVVKADEAPPPEQQPEHYPPSKEA